MRNLNDQPTVQASIANSIAVSNIFFMGYNASENIIRCPIGILANLLDIVVYDVPCNKSSYFLFTYGQIGDD